MTAGVSHGGPSITSRRKSSATMTKYNVHRIHLAPIAKFGCLLGILASLIPSLICSLGGMRLLFILRHWLESWREVEFEVLSLPITLDFIELLQLTPLLEQLQSINWASLALVFALVILLSLIGGLLIFLIVTLVGLGYNFLAWLTGGVVVDLKEVKPRET